MKKILITVALIMTMASSCFAAGGMTEQFYKFSASDEDAVTEVNYYLGKGGIVKFMDTEARGNGSVLITMVVQIPSDVFSNEKYVKKSK